MKNTILRILAVLLTITAFVISPSFDYWKYKLIEKNDEIIFLDIDQNNVRNYSELLTLEEFKGKPS